MRVYMHPDSHFQSSSYHHCGPPNHFTTEENLSGDHPDRLSNATLAVKVLREMQNDVEKHHLDSRWNVNCTCCKTKSSKC